MDRSNAVKEAATSRQSMLSWSSRLSLEESAPKVAIYCRVSSIKQANEDTISVQLTTCQRLFEKKFGAGKDCLVGIYSDEGYNLEQVDEARQFWRLVADIRDGKVNHVIVASENRIFRGSSSKLRGHINDVFREARVTLVTSEGAQHFKPSQTTDRIKLAVTQELGAINKIEMVKTLQNARRTRLEEDKNFRPAIHPYGFRLKITKEGKRKQTEYVIHEDEAAIVRDVFALYIGAKPTTVPSPEITGPLGTKRIAAWLNANGFNKQSYLDSLQPGQAAALRLEFTAMGLTHLLRNPAYMGEAVVFFKETSSSSTFEADALLQKIVVPAIVSPAAFQAAQRIRDDKSDVIKAQFSTSAQARNWLHGVIPCMTCGWTLRGVTGSNGDRYYACPRKKQDDREHRSFRAEDVELPLQRRLLSMFDENFDFDRFLSHFLINNKEAANNLQQELEKVTTSIEANKKKLERLVDGFTDGIIPRETYVAKKAEIDTQLEAASKRLADIQSQLSNDAQQQLRHVERLSDIEKAISKLKSGEAKNSPAFLRLVMRAAVQEIKLMPLPTPDVSTMSIAEIRAAFNSGRIVPKHLTDSGWSWRRIAKELGKCGRKQALDFQFCITWLNSSHEELLPY